MESTDSMRFLQCCCCWLCAILGIILLNDYEIVLILFVPLQVRIWVFPDPVVPQFIKVLLGYSVFFVLFERFGCVICICFFIAKRAIFKLQLLFLTLGSLKVSRGANRTFIKIRRLSQSFFEITSRPVKLILPKLYRVDWLRRNHFHTWHSFDFLPLSNLNSLRVRITLRAISIQSLRRSIPTYEDFFGARNGTLNTFIAVDGLVALFVDGAYFRIHFDKQSRWPRRLRWPIRIIPPLISLK